MTTGSCLCGGVRYRVTGPLRPVIACHCTQCRKTSGHHVAATACAPEHLEIVSAATLSWFRASPAAARGFCGTCGGNLFWRPDHGRHVSIFAGTLDAPTGLRMAMHIHTRTKSDYFDLTDGLPAWPEEEEVPA